MEDFRDITTYDGCLYGLYEISRDGVLRNKKTGYTTRGSYDMDGYLRTSLKTNEGKRRGFKIHQLVLRTFVGEPPVGKDIVNHKNEIKDDNRVENLEWCDAAYNATYGTAKERMRETVIKNGSHIGFHPSKESIKKMRETSLKNRYPGMTMEEIEVMLIDRKKPVPKEVASKHMSESQKKRWTEEMREQKRQDMLGEKNPMYGKKHKEESVRRSADGHKKVIYQFSSTGEFIREWDSSTSAAKYYGVVVNAITNAIDSKYKSCGYYWRRRRDG